MITNDQRQKMRDINNRTRSLVDVLYTLGESMKPEPHVTVGISPPPDPDLVDLVQRKIPQFAQDMAELWIIAKADYQPQSKASALNWEDARFLAATLASPYDEARLLIQKTRGEWGLKRFLRALEALAKMGMEI